MSEALALPMVEKPTWECRTVGGDLDDPKFLGKELSQSGRLARDVPIGVADISPEINDGQVRLWLHGDVFVIQCWRREHRRQ